MALTEQDRAIRARLAEYLLQTAEREEKIAGYTTRYAERAFRVAEALEGGESLGLVVDENYAGMAVVAQDFRVPVETVVVACRKGK